MWGPSLCFFLLVFIWLPRGFSCSTWIFRSAQTLVVAHVLVARHVGCYWLIRIEPMSSHCQADSETQPAADGFCRPHDVVKEYRFPPLLHASPQNRCLTSLCPDILTLLPPTEILAGAKNWTNFTYFLSVRGDLFKSFLERKKTTPNSVWLGWRLPGGPVAHKLHAFHQQGAQVQFCLWPRVPGFFMLHRRPICTYIPG